MAGRGKGGKGLGRGRAASDSDEECAKKQREAEDSEHEEEPNCDQAVNPAKTFLDVLRVYLDGDKEAKRAQILKLTSTYQVRDMPDLVAMTPEQMNELTQLKMRLWQSVKRNTLNQSDPELVGMDNVAEMALYVRIEAKYF